jgi:hypothetical protein
VADVLEFAAGRAAPTHRPGGTLAALGLDPGLLIRAEQDRVVGNVLVEVADLVGSGKEPGVVGAVEPATDPLGSDIGLGQDPPDRAGGDRYSPLLVQALGDGRVGGLLPGQQEADLDHHAELTWSQLGGVDVRWRGGYGYVIGFLDDDEDDDAEEESLPLCRLGYLGFDDIWEFALYDPATGSYQDAVLPDCAYTGPLTDILDCACQIHLADIAPRPPQP